MFRVISSRMLEAEKHSYGCLMGIFPKKIASQIKEYAASHIDDNFIYKTDEVKGLEDQIHVTVKYGFHTKSGDAVKKVVSGFGPFSIKLTTISKFSPEDEEYDVLKIGVESAKLRELNALVSKELKNTDKHPVYKPHVTLAYVKKGTCQNLIGSKEFEGTEITFDWLEYNSADDVHTKIEL